ncbi:MAG: type-F conjugative transfer system secretin TraK [Desulfuromonadales bacterium]|nr:type-F conjugative transfer system secretin TraK [Desulfuromonadales bacterium]
MRKSILSMLSILLLSAHLAYGENPVQPASSKTTPSASPIHQAEKTPSGPFPAELQQQIVMPEVSTQVSLSSSDANRIVCSQEIKDVIFSSEKGVSVKAVGRNAFVKFRITRKDDREIYSTTPTELFVVCGESVYNLIAIPKRIPAQTVRLSPGTEKIRHNAAIYGSLPFEKKILAVIKAVYTGEIPEGFSARFVNRKLQLFKDLDLTLARIFRVEGEGLSIKEFSVSSRKVGEELKIREKDFLVEAVAVKPVGLALDRHTLKAGETARLIVVEQVVNQGREGGADGAQGEN